MRRYALIIISLALIYNTVFAELPVDFFIESEYKHDTIDYNETEKTYYREKINIFFSRESFFNLSCIYLQDSDIYKYTWNLTLNDLSPYFSLFIGNYFVNFGTGLLIGRKKLYEPDIFTTRDLRETNTFSASKSGNPVYAFNGIAGASYFKVKYLEISFNAFYSIQERFISQDAYESGQIPSSLNSIDNNITELNTKNEQIEIHTKGVMISAVFLKHIITQIYTIMTDLRSFYKEDINWDYDEAYNESRSISQLAGYGCMLKYKDDYFCFVMDYSLTRKEVVLDNSIKKTEYGHGSLYGIEFNHPFVLLALTGKLVNSSYYSPYSSSVGDDYPESACFLDIEIKPYSNLKLKLETSSQKREVPSSVNQESPVTLKKNFSVLYKYGSIKKIQIGFKRRKKTDDEKDKKTQANSAIYFAILDNLSLKFSALYQADEQNNSSKMYHSGFEFNVKKYLRINLHYMKAEISKDDTIYSIISPIRNSSTRGFFIRQDSNFIIARSDIKIRNIYFSCRYAFQFRGNESISKRLEFFASGYF